MSARLHGARGWRLHRTYEARSAAALGADGFRADLYRKYGPLPEVTVRKFTRYAFAAEAGFEQCDAGTSSKAWRSCTAKGWHTETSRPATCWSPRKGSPSWQTLVGRAHRNPRRTAHGVARAGVSKDVATTGLRELGVIDLPPGTRSRQHKTGFQSMVGSPFWMAPEIAKMALQEESKSDGASGYGRSGQSALLSCRALC